MFFVFVGGVFDICLSFRGVFEEVKICNRNTKNVQTPDAGACDLCSQPSRGVNPWKTPGESTVRKRAVKLVSIVKAVLRAEAEA